MLRFESVLGLAVLFAGGAYAEVPQQINHQGVVRVGGVPFSGTGLFKFAIVDPDLDLPNGRNLWTNDGVNQGTTGDPTAAVSISVTGGVYTVALGNTGPPENMTAIPSSVFNDDNAVLRIWFDDGVNGNQQLSPDHKLTTAPYSFRLPNITVDDNGNVGIGDNNPGARLEVFDTVPPSVVQPMLNLTGFFTTGAPDQGQAIDFRINSDDTNNPAVRIAQSLADGSGGILSFLTSTDYTQSAPVERMKIDNNGHIGIGTSSPLTPLHVSADGGEMLRLETTMPSPLTGIGLSFVRMESIQKTISLAGNNDLQIFQGNGSDDSAANRLFVTMLGDGNTFFRGDVGIGGFPVDRFHVFGNILATGSITPGSSREFKKDIEDLALGDAIETIRKLAPVTFRYKEDKENDLHVGFIAEDVPDLIATPDRKGVTTMDVVAALTKVVQHQQGSDEEKDCQIAEQRSDIQELRVRIAHLEALVGNLAQTQTHRRN